MTLSLALVIVCSSIDSDGIKEEHFFIALMTDVAISLLPFV